MKFENLEEYRRWIWNCQQCSTCQKGPQNPFWRTGPTADWVCPSYDRYRRLSYSAQGRLAAARAVMEGTLEIDDDFVESLYECTLCGACGPDRMGRASCCVERKQVPIFRAFRADLVRMGKGPTEPYRKIAAAIKKQGNRFGAKVSKTRWVPEGMNLPEKADTVFFAGCVASYKATEIAQATARLFQRAGAEFTILGDDEWCCGNPLVDSGQGEAFTPVVEHNMEAFRKAGATRIVTSCACCYHVLKFRYPEAADTSGLEVLHAAEVLAEWIDQGKLKAEKTVPQKVTYQDPCHLTRLGTPGAPVFEQPRALLKSIPGLEFVEMEANGEYTQCCGRLPVEQPEMALNSGKTRIRDARAVGAETIVTACSFCDWNLTRTAKELDDGMQVMDITRLLAQAVGR
jgi:Fe-S oxidoreductase